MDLGGVRDTDRSNDLAGHVVAWLLTGVVLGVAVCSESLLLGIVGGIGAVLSFWWSFAAFRD